MALKVLFISHEATLTGAPQSLLNIKEWMQANSDLSFEILLKKTGPLKPRYDALAPVLDFTPTRATLLKRVGYKLGLKPPENIYDDVSRFQKLRQQLKASQFDLIYANTITNGELLDFLAPLKCPIITHVRELEHVIQVFGPKNLDFVKRYTSYYIATAQVVKDNLVKNHGIPAAQVEAIPTFIKPETESGSLPTTDAHPLRELGIPENAYVIGGCGTRDWRKGTDLFLHLARILGSAYRGRPVYWVWVGGRPESPFAQQLQFDLTRMGLQDRVYLIDDVTNPLDYLKELTVFILTSREDPLARVLLEAALLQKPIVCFDQAGGGPEFVETDCGFVVPYLHLDRMVEKIQYLLGSPDLCRQMGTVADQKVRERHSVEISAPQILKTIQRTASQG